MKLRTERYVDQEAKWPQSGRHILAQFDSESIIVYQAYKHAIGRYAASQGRLGAGFSRDRMTWIKPNFLWMMYRSGWGTKPDQEVTLAIRLKRDAFDEILNLAVHSKHISEVYGDNKAWRHAIKTSSVRLQWDPDHHPSGASVDRRAIQLGLRGPAVDRFVDEWTLEIEDISNFVAEQQEALRDGTDYLVTPQESVYPVSNEAVANKLGISLLT